MYLDSMLELTLKNAHVSFPALLQLEQGWPLPGSPLQRILRLRQRAHWMRDLSVDWGNRETINNIQPLEYDVLAEHSHPALDLVRYLDPRVRTYADEYKDHGELLEEGLDHGSEDNYAHGCSIGEMIAHRHHNNLE